MFFEATDVISKAPVDLLIPKCGACGLHKTCMSPKMPVTGNGKQGILIIAEAPGCISGDSLIDTAFRDKSVHPEGIPIRDLVGRDDVYVYSFDVDQNALRVVKAKRIWSTGIKPVFRVTYYWYFATKDGSHQILKNHLDVTSNHKFLLKKEIKGDPFLGHSRHGKYVSIDDGLVVGHSIQPFHRRNEKYYKVGPSWQTMKRESRILLEAKIGRSLARGEECHHKDRNKHNDSWDNLILLTQKDHARLHGFEDNPMSDPAVRKRHAEVMKSDEYRSKLSKKMKEVLADPEVYKKRMEQISKSKGKMQATLKERYKEPLFYYNYLLGKKKCSDVPDDWVIKKFKSKFPDEDIPVDNHKIISIEYIGKQEVFDIEVPEFHNFAVNGVFVHNSEEDYKNEQLIGPAGQQLRSSLWKCGVDLDEDCWKTNSLICRPPGNLTPTKKQIDYCRPNLTNTIRELNPRIIIPLGGVAVRSLLGPLWREDVGPITKWAGWRIPLQKYNAWVCPNRHPSHVLHAREDRIGPVVKLWFERYLEEAVELPGRPWETIPNYKSEIQVITNPEIVSKQIREFIELGGPVAFDYETNCLKPHTPGAEIVSCAVCWMGLKTIAYPWVGEAITATSELLQSRLPKIGYNNKFEEGWTRRHLKHSVNNWVWDGMQAAHVLDNRKEITGAKFQSLVRLGLENYDSEVKPFLTATDRSGLNTIRRCDPRKLLVYNGVDSLVEYKIAVLQRKEFGL